MANLTEAVQLIRQGRKDEARRILEPILKANPQDIQAWFWFVETCSTQEQRVKTLEICLKLNPGNPQALRALRALQARPFPSASSTPPASRPSAPPSSAPQPSAPQPSVPQPSAPQPSAPQPSVPQPSVPQPSVPQPSVPQPSVPQPSVPQPSVPQPAVRAFIFDEPEPQSPAFETSGTGWQQPRSESKLAFDWDALEKESAPVGRVFQEPLLPEEPSPQPRGKSLPFYRVWWQAVSAQSVAGYASIFDDPDAGAGRALEWMAYTSVVTGLLLPFMLLFNPQFAELRDLPEFQQLTGGIEWTTLLLVLGLGMAVVTPILSVIGLAINAWIYNMLAILFGGKGTFGRTAYGQAAYLAPISLIATLLNLIPVVGSCLAAPVGIYSILLNIRALMAAHDLPLGRALSIILLPGILISVLCCVLGLLFGPVLANALLTSGY